MAINSMAIKMRMAAMIVAVGLGAVCAHAQNLPDAPSVCANVVSAVADAEKPAPALATVAVKEPVRRERHRFFDKMSVALTGMEVSAMLADGVTTANRLGQTRTEYQMVNGTLTPVQTQLTEADPIGRLFVNRGWPGMIAGGAMNVGADLGIRYLLHRTNHHKMERVVPMLFTASSAFAAIHNTRY